MLLLPILLSKFSAAAAAAGGARQYFCHRVRGLLTAGSNLRLQPLQAACGAGALRMLELLRKWHLQALKHMKCFFLMSYILPLLMLQAYTGTSRHIQVMVGYG
jgi:hypothetical protein